MSKKACTMKWVAKDLLLGEDSRPPARTPQIRAQLRAKNGGGSTSSGNNEPTLRWKTLMRKRVENNQQHKGKVSLFRSPSIFDKVL